MNPKPGMIVRSRLGADYKVLSVENGIVKYQCLNAFEDYGYGDLIDTMSIDSWLECSKDDLILSEE